MSESEDKVPETVTADNPSAKPTKNPKRVEAAREAAKKTKEAREAQKRELEALNAEKARNGSWKTPREKEEISKDTSDN